MDITLKSIKHGFNGATSVYIHDIKSIMHGVNEAMSVYRHPKKSWYMLTQVYTSESSRKCDECVEWYGGMVAPPEWLMRSLKSKKTGKVKTSKFYPPPPIWVSYVAGFLFFWAFQKWFICWIIPLGFTVKSATWLEPKTHVEKSTLEVFPSGCICLPYLVGSGNTSIASFQQTSTIQFCSF